jgi:spermidine/putrescine transport system substrate-binding protein
MRSELDGLMRTRVGRRALLKYMGATALVGGSGVLAACRREAQGSSGAASPTSRPSIEAEPGVLKVYEWAGYDTKWLWHDYAAAGFADPKFSFFTNTEQAIAKTAGGYRWDVSHPETEYVQDYAELGLLQPWDTSLISNFPNLNPSLEKAGQYQGKQYNIVLDWGYSGVIIRTDHVDPDINSYSYLFDDKYEGHISWFDTPAILQQAALVLGTVSDIWDMSAADLETCKNYCIDKKKNLHSIWVDFTQMWDDVRQGSVWTAYSWQDAYAVLREEVPVAYIKPKEGVLSWAEGLVLQTESQDYYHAHEYADAWASPEVGTRLTNSWGYGHANLDIDISELDPDLVKVFGLDDPVTALSEPYSLIFRHLPNREAYNRAWDEVKAA